MPGALPYLVRRCAGRDGHLANETAKYADNLRIGRSESNSVSVVLDDTNNRYQIHAGQPHYVLKECQYPFG